MMKTDNNIYGRLSLAAENTVKALSQRGKTLACAESCTGGMLAENVTSVSGASAVFGLGVVSYSCEMKQSVLGVRGETLAEFGAVSATTAEEMALGVRLKAGAHIGISVTGVAGPTASEGKPVGLVFIGLSTAEGTTSYRLSFGEKTREYIRVNTCIRAFEIILDYLKGI